MSLRSRLRTYLDRLTLFAPVRYLRDRRSTTLTVGHGLGLRFASGPSNPSYGVGDNELPVQDVLARHLRPGDVVVDVGANVGFLTVIAARIVGAKGRVYAFEPVHDNATLIRRNAALNGFGQIAVIEEAVSDHTGTDRLVLAAYSGGAALAVADRPPDAVREETVRTVTLDDAISSGVVQPPSLVKIDVEGAEIQVLHGMVHTLEKHRPVVLYEIDGSDESTVTAKAAVCRAFLETHRYSVTRIEDSYLGARWRVEHYLALPQT